MMKTLIKLWGSVQRLPYLFCLNSAYIVHFLVWLYILSSGIAFLKSILNFISPFLNRICILYLMTVLNAEIFWLNQIFIKDCIYLLVSHECRWGKNLGCEMKSTASHSMIKKFKIKWKMDKNTSPENLIQVFNIENSLLNIHPPP